MPVLYEQTDRVVTITINRPDAMNAIDPETHNELIDGWVRFRDDPEGWVAILTGAGEKAFSAGADLKLMPTARRWAQTLLERGPLAVRAAKEAVIRGLSLPLADGLRLEAFLSGTLRGSEDAVEGPKAFAEKRKPVFKAR